MKKILVISLIFFSVAVVVHAQTAGTANCNFITDGIGGGTWSCPPAETAPATPPPTPPPATNTAGCDYVVDSTGGGTWTCPNNSTINGVTGATTPPTVVPGNPATTPTAPPAATGCPNGGQMVNGTCNLGYTPLEPIPGLTSGTNVVDPTQLPKLISAIFTILITIGALFSVLMLTVGGVRYMLSDVVTSKELAKKRMEASIWGLLLIAGAWLILHTINPQLLNFTFYPGSGSAVAPPSTSSTGTVSQTQTIQASAAQVQQLGLQNNSVLLYNNQDAASINGTIAQNMNTCQQQQGFANIIPGTQVGGTSNQSAEVCQQPTFLQSVTAAMAQ